MRAMAVTHVDWRIYYQPRQLFSALGETFGDSTLLGPVSEGVRRYVRTDTGFQLVESRDEFVAPKFIEARLRLFRLEQRLRHELADPELGLVVGFDLASLAPLLRWKRRFPGATLGAWFLEYEDDGYQANRRTRYALAQLRRHPRVLSFVVDTNSERLARRDWLPPDVPRFVLPNCPNRLDPRFSHENGMNRRERSGGAAGGGPTLVYSGTNAEFARLDALVEGIARSRTKPRCELYLMGDRERSEALGRTIAALGLSDRVRVLEPLPPDELAIALNRDADAGVVFSDASTGAPINRVHPSPNKLGEYLAAGLAVLASDNSTLRFVAEAGAGETCDPARPDSVAAAIDRLFAPGAAPLMGAKGRALFERERNFEAVSAPLLEWLRTHRDATHPDRP